MRAVLPAFDVGAATMKGADQNHRQLYIYQMRSGWGEAPHEILTRLTPQVWQTFDKRQASHGGTVLDPHLWPEIFHTFRRAFRNRLTHSPAGGLREDCLSVPCVLCGRQAQAHPPLNVVYLLETRRPLPRFLKAVASAVARRLRSKGVRSGPGDKPVPLLLQESMIEALKQNFFMNEVCLLCPVRREGGDRRIWARDILESPWGGIRSILPEEVPLVEEIEEA